jgi:hypothetical protein
MLGASGRTFVLVGQSVLEATFSILACLCAKRRQSKVVLHALLVFLVGFGGATVYRLAYVVDVLGWVDFKNGLMFGIPAALAVLYGRLLAQRQ